MSDYPTYRAVGQVAERLAHQERRNCRARKSSRRQVSVASQRETRNRPAQSAELPTQPHLPPNCGRGDPSLTPEDGCHMVLRKDQS